MYKIRHQPQETTNITCAEFTFSSVTQNKYSPYFFRVGDYKLIVGSPGIYNRWFSVPKSSSFCTDFADDIDERNEDDIFLYENLNIAVRNLKSYLYWFGKKLPGYSYWKQLRRMRMLRECKASIKKEKSKWVFPKYLLYNIKGIYKFNSIGVSCYKQHQWTYN